MLKNSFSVLRSLMSSSVADAASFSPQRMFCSYVVSRKYSVLRDSQRNRKVGGEQFVGTSSRTSFSLVRSFASPMTGRIK